MSFTAVARFASPARLAAHAWTVWPVVRRLAGAPPAPPSAPWSIEIADTAVGPVRLTGRLSPLAGRGDAGPSTLLLLVHGLGGSTESTYMRRTASVAHELGLAVLRLNLRGADRRRGDLYHAGLSSDLGQALASPELAGFERVLVFGFSLGGHLALRFATEVADPRLRAVAAACAPLDLDLSVAAIDRPSGWIYRRYVLASLSRMYAAVAPHNVELGSLLPLSVVDARRIRSLREWDRRTVVPRFAFDSPEDYYRRAGVGCRLHRLRVPALLVAAEADPMVPRQAIAEPVAAHRDALERLTLRWVRYGGHLAFPAGLDLGEDAPVGLAGQVIGWLQRMAVDSSGR